MSCNNCNLCEIASSICLEGRGSKKATIMFIQDYPSELDDISEKVFSGKSNRAIEKSMFKRDIDVDDVYYTSLVKCNPDTTKVKSIHVKACQGYLEQEIKDVDPDILVPLGDLSLRFCGLTGTVGKCRGSAVYSDLLGRERIVLPMQHPRRVPDKPAFKEFILKDLDTLANLYESGKIVQTQASYEYCETYEECINSINQLSKSKVVSFDLETSSKNPYESGAHVLCASFSNKPRTGVTIPLFHPESPISSEEALKVVEALKLLLENPKITKVAQNGKFDMSWLSYVLGVRVKNFVFDTMYGHYLAVSEEQGTQSLESLSWSFTDMGGYDNELKEFKKSLPTDKRTYYGNIPWNILKKYAAGDADCTLRLYYTFLPMIEENPKWVRLMSDVLMPASYALMEVEENGLKFDSELASKYAETYRAEIDRIQSRLNTYPEVVQLEREKQQLFQERELIKAIPKRDRTPEEQEKFEKYKKYDGYKFNWGSVSQLSELLYDRLGLVTSVKTDTGSWSTGDEALHEIEKQHEIPSLLLELRKVTTLNNMFISKLPDLVDNNGLVHPSFNITGTVTGRLSSQDPNIQQIPRKAEDCTLFQYHNEVKSLFISRYGDNGCILNADYSALEMRVAAILSGDEHLAEAFLSGKDLHKATASKVFRIPIDEVTKDDRTKAKAVNFGIIYGKSGATFGSEQFFDPSGKLPGRTADWDKAKKMGNKLVEDYLNAFPQLKSWLIKTKKDAVKHGYVETMFGRRRRLPDLKSRVYSLKSDAERQAINAPVQGTGSDLTLMSTTQLNNWLKESKMKSKVVATVHDSIVFDVYIPELPEVAKKAKEIMENVHKPFFDTVIPIVSELEMGRNYGSTFDVTIEEVMKIKTAADFNKWEHSHKIEKYKNELSLLHHKGWSLEQVCGYLEAHDRPFHELREHIVDLYCE